MGDLKLQNQNKNDFLIKYKLASMHDGTNSKLGSLIIQVYNLSRGIKVLEGL